MYIGRPIYFEYAQAQPRKRFEIRLATVLFTLLAIIGPIVFAHLVVAPSTGEVPAFIGP